VQALVLQGVVRRESIRDTALYPPLMGVREGTGKLYNRALRHVVLEELGVTIQSDEHDPVQDARAALYLYHRHR
jgi:RNA exonuclease 4